MKAVYPMALVVSGTKQIIMGLALAAAVMFPRTDALAKQSGTSILHFNFSSAMTNTGVDPDASGNVTGKLTRQGNASNQQLKISLANLDPSTTYELAAFLGDDTNSTSVAEFTTDSKGAFKITYVKKATGNPSANQHPLPDALNPLRNIRELDIVNGSTQTVLQVDLTNTGKLQYLVKRLMDNAGLIPAAAGLLQIKASATFAQFRLTASGLTPNTAYVLTINGNAVQTNTSDSAGNLNLTSLPPGAPDVLDIHAVALTDITGHVVLTVGGGSGGVGLPLDGQASVALRSANSFVVLAGSTVTSTGSTTVDGDLGVSPGTAVVGFPPGSVIGTIFNVTPGPAATAQGDLTTAFNDAKGRTVGAITVAGNLGGQTLTPGLYKSTSSLEISSGDLTLDAQGDANAVFIFQMASTLTTTSGRQVILSGGAKAANVFWQVGSSATLGTGSSFKGTIMADQSISLTTGATLEGRALARIGAVTMDSNTIGLAIPADIAPTVSSTFPANAATGVAIGGNIAAFFSEAMNPLTITTATFTLKQGATPVAGTVTYVGVTATFNPTSTLAASTIYTATITTGAKDLTGNALAAGFSWSFTTGTTLDTTAPTVSSTIPANAATGVAVGGNIAATFSEAMDPSTITTNTFTLKQGATPVAGAVTYVGVTATFNPTSTLATGTTYTAMITTGAKDLAGNALAAGFSWSFTTGATPDTTAPTVSSTVPTNAATGVAIGGNIAAVFSEAMNPLTITTATFTLKQGLTRLDGTVTYVGVTATFNPTSNLAPSTTYTAQITAGAKDLAGNPLTVNFNWSFTTGTTPDTTAPTVSATVPTNGATDVAINQTINVTLSEAMDPLTINTATLLLTGPGATAVTGTVGYDVPSKIATFTPASSLDSNTVYIATLTTGAKDLAGNALAADFNWSFSTAATPAGQAPVAMGAATTFAVLGGSTVTSLGTTTVNGNLGVSPGTAVTGFFTVDAGPGIVNGTIYNVTPGPAATAQLDLTTAFNDAAGRTVGAITVAGNLGGQTLTPGLYTSTSSLEISSGDLTLDAQGDANAVFIFQMASTLTTTAGRQVILSGGAKAANIFWQVGTSATLGTTSVFKGTIMANQSITLTTGATLEGRALAQTGAVTMDSNTITVPVP
ncbi:MAG TPA: ice-binding family protein [Verrucomicrobiae bacterium]|nr:ice-binding family protein [Verrucomicrobiae bacterium]